MCSSCILGICKIWNRCWRCAESNYWTGSSSCSKPGCCIPCAAVWQLVRPLQRSDTVGVHHGWKTAMWGWDLFITHREVLWGEESRPLEASRGALWHTVSEHDQHIDSTHHLRAHSLIMLRWFWQFLTPYPHVRVCKIFQTPLPYSYVRFHFVFQHNKMLLEKDQLH